MENRGFQEVAKTKLETLKAIETMTQCFDIIKSD